MPKPLSISFYNKPTIDVAKQLLGKFLCRRAGKKLYVGKIVETEAYLGKKDLACHSSRGKTERNKTMFGRAGRAYVYFIYGMYYCFNVVTEEENNPCAVLIRALEPISMPKSFESKFADNSSLFNILDGPGKLCREFRIDRKLDGWDLTKGKRLWIEKGEKIEPSQIGKSKRIGVDYAPIWRDKMLRFYIKNSKFVSKARV